MLVRIAVCSAWLFSAAGVALADPAFIPLPLPASNASTSSASAPAADRSAEIERAGRELRQRLELRELEQRGSRSRLDAYRVRELRELERGAPNIPRGDAARVRGDIDRARERLELERRIDLAEERLRARQPGEH